MNKQLFQVEWVSGTMDNREKLGKRASVSSEFAWETELQE